MWGERRSLSRARAAGAGLVIVLLVFLGGLSNVSARTCDACRIVQVTPRPTPTVVGLPLKTQQPTVTMPPTDTLP